MALQCPLQEGAVVQMGDVSPGLARSCQHGTGSNPCCCLPVGTMESKGAFSWIWYVLEWERMVV